MGWPKLQNNNCTTLGLVQCKFRKRLAKHDQQQQKQKQQQQK
jgi:hypothetical protein